MRTLLNDRKHVLAILAASVFVVAIFVSKALGASGLDDDVKLLLHGSVGDNVVTTLRDSSFSNHTVTLNGNAASVSDKFSQSGFFDGNGDYISVPNNNDFKFGTGDFTIDFWVRLTSTSGSPTMVTVGDHNDGVRLVYLSNMLQIFIVGSNIMNPSWTPTANTWYHVAIVRSGSTVRAFVNGSEIGSASNTSNMQTTQAVQAGSRLGGGDYLNGYIDELRISKGVARWTSNFTPPTSPYSSDANTSLLLHMDGTAGSTTFTDSSGSPKTVTASGNAVLSSFSKFGGDGISFDGSGDYILLNGSSDFAFGTDDFAIDFWFSPTSLAGGSSLFNTRTNCSAVTNTLSLERSGTGLLVYASGATRITGGTLTLGNWHHIALTRSGTDTKLFLDGVQVGSTYTDTNNYVNNTSRPSIGICGDLTLQPLAGHLDEYRVSKGVARWTANFTPPTEAYGLAGTNLVGNVKFLRNIAVIGSLSKGAGTFVIDHPQKPRTHLLYHSFVESNEVKNLYDGIVELDANGEAVIRLPDYFEELNKDFRYQYFPIGAPMPNLYVKEKVKNNQFVLAGGKPGGRVSWQVTGVRHDPYIEANPLQVEVEKGPDELVDKGECLHEEACI